MRQTVFWISYVLLLLGQLLLSNYFHFTPYVMLTILPVMVLCISIRVHRILAMLIAFATGLVADLLSDGLLGLNALALVPVAFVRDPIIRFLFGTELFARKEDFTVQNQGLGKVAFAVFMALALFLVVYIWADGAGMRPLWFNAARYGASLGASWLVSLLTLHVLASDSRR